MNMSQNYCSVVLFVVLLLFAGCREQTKVSQNGHEHTTIEHLPYSIDEMKEMIAHTPSTQIEEVRQKVENTLNRIYAEKMPDYFPNWIAFHAILMYGDSAYENYHSGKSTDENLKRIFTILQNSKTDDQGPFVLRGDLPYPRHAGPHFMQEHHTDQFLHYFSMSGASLDAKLAVNDKEYTFHDLLERSFLEAKTTNELAYTVLVYSHFLEPGQIWKNKFGEPMSLAILLEKLLKTPEATCLGTHRLSALARVYAQKELKPSVSNSNDIFHEKTQAANEPRPLLTQSNMPDRLRSKEIEKLWDELERQVLEALVRLKESQQEDGAFEPPGLTAGTQSQDNIDVYYTGHSLEWITFLGEDYCHDDWVVRTAEKVSNAIDVTYQSTFRNMDAAGNEESHFDFDGLCHAISALKRWKDQTQQ